MVWLQGVKVEPPKEARRFGAPQDKKLRLPRVRCKVCPVYSFEEARQQTSVGLHENASGQLGESQDERQRVRGVRGQVLQAGPFEEARRLEAQRRQVGPRFLRRFSVGL